MHLLSREAIRLYRAKLAPGGILLFNLTNRYLDLDPVIGRQAADAALVCRVCHDLDVSDREKQAGKQASIWAVMAAEESNLAGLASDSRWRVPGLRPAPWSGPMITRILPLIYSSRNGADERADHPTATTPGRG